MLGPFRSKTGLAASHFRRATPRSQAGGRARDPSSQVSARRAHRYCGATRNRRYVPGGRAAHRERKRRERERVSAGARPHSEIAHSGPMRSAELGAHIGPLASGAQKCAGSLPRTLWVVAPSESDDVLCLLAIVAVVVVVVVVADVACVLWS